MKKAKVMLVAIAVFATVGAALAFKVKTFGETTYCYLTTESEPSSAQCNKIRTDATALPWSSGNKIFYTAKPANVACGEVACPEVARAFEN